jgi:hypothetical protein
MGERIAPSGWIWEFHGRLNSPELRRHPVAFRLSALFALMQALEASRGKPRRARFGC